MNERAFRQMQIHNWTQAAFGDEEANDLKQRALRMLEEVIELYQSVDGDKAQAHELLDYVFSRPKGDHAQELGGVGCTVLAFAAAAGTSADMCEAVEVARVLSKPVEHFTQRNAAKNAAGFKAR